MSPLSQKKLFGNMEEKRGTNSSEPNKLLQILKEQKKKWEAEIKQWRYSTYEGSRKTDPYFEWHFLMFHG